MELVDQTRHLSVDPWDDVKFHSQARMLSRWQQNTSTLISEDFKTLLWLIEKERGDTISNIFLLRGFFIWVFPKIWENPQIIHFHRVFHYFHHPFWGVLPPSTPIWG